MKLRQAKKIEKRVFSDMKDSALVKLSYKISTIGTACKCCGFRRHHIIRTNFGMQHRWTEEDKDAFGYPRGENPYDLHLKMKKDENR